VAIQIPKEINGVTQTVNPGWTVEKVMGELKPAIKDSHRFALAYWHLMRLLFLSPGDSPRFLPKSTHYDAMADHDPR
jgi:hypothetical protein